MFIISPRRYRLLSGFSDRVVDKIVSVEFYSRTTSCYVRVVALCKSDFINTRNYLCLQRTLIALNTKIIRFKANCTF